MPSAAGSVPHADKRKGNKIILRYMNSFMAHRVRCVQAAYRLFRSTALSIACPTVLEVAASRGAGGSWEDSWIGLPGRRIGLDRDRAHFGYRREFPGLRSRRVGSRGSAHDRLASTSTRVVIVRWRRQVAVAAGVSPVCPGPQRGAIRKDISRIAKSYAGPLRPGHFLKFPVSRIQPFSHPCFAALDRPPKWLCRVMPD